MFGWIPVLGPIIDGIVSIWKGYQNQAIVKYRVDGTVDIEAMKASADIIAQTKDNIWTNIVRDIIMIPVAIWMGFIAWDNIVVYVYPDLFWKVSAYPPGMEYLPYAVVAYLFGTAGITIWKRR